MSNQNPTRDLITVTTRSKVFLRNFHKSDTLSKFDIISKNDFEVEIMSVKTKTFTSDIQTHWSA